MSNLKGYLLNYGRKILNRVGQSSVVKGANGPKGLGREWYRPKRTRATNRRNLRGRGERTSPHRNSEEIAVPQRENQEGKSSRGIREDGCCFVLRPRGFGSEKKPDSGVGGSWTQASWRSEKRFPIVSGKKATKAPSESCLCLNARERGN